MAALKGVLKEMNNIDEAKIKEMFKAAIIEVIEENQELVREILDSAFEDIAMVRAIREGETTQLVTRRMYSMPSGAE
jgi:hypothetical protein